ncbi:response regulator transcription factor [Streptomyces sp. R28]|uniref:Sensory transduction protein RegX3 n=1 Tax=Streptomyces sp. R28 TaxID=3238628 RepID=A0AB39Q6B5_9ACTN
MNLLLVEDDSRQVATLAPVLARHGFRVTYARSGGEALDALASRDAGFDLVLLDLGLPDMDGYEVCGEIRKRITTPIIMVSTRGEVRSRIHGLNLGAADYVVKPYDTGELLARIHAVIRRTASADAVERVRTVLYLGSVIIDLPTRQVSVDNSFIQLTPKEFDLLALLARRPGVVVTREQIMGEVWRAGGEGTGNTLGTHIASLRAKLRMPALIETVRGVGYRAVTPAE